jgi:hypothetical protein
MDEAEIADVTVTARGAAFNAYVLNSFLALDVSPARPEP